MSVLARSIGSSVSLRCCYRCFSSLRERIDVARETNTSVASPEIPTPRRRRPRSVLLKTADGSSVPRKGQSSERPKRKSRSKATEESPSATHSTKVLTRRRPRQARAKVEDEVKEESSTNSNNIDSEPAQKSGVVDIDAPEKIPVPKLAHGLDRVLFNPGVYYLQDPRSHVYNFDPYLQEITPVKDFNFDALTEYITSSRDLTLDELARTHDLKVVGSTSSMTAVLSQFHYFISKWRPVNLKRLSSAFKGKTQKFTTSQRAPASIYLRHNDGIYAIDADKSLNGGETVLSFLGRSMEKMLTLDPEEFSKLRKDSTADAPTEKAREAYHYSKLGSMLMRSQLDCQDSRLPGNGTFDLKTRAVLPVRMDVKNAHEGAGYQIVQSTGLLESFEREYYDMIRAAFLKYSLQVRIGKMDGIFVAYHNTERIFGFQYISLEEMDDCIHGSSDSNIAHREFLMSLKQLDKVLEIAIGKYPGQSMALSFETSETKPYRMSVVIEPLSEEEIKRRQAGELLEALRAAQRNERINKMPSSSKSTNSKGTLESMSTTLEQIIAKSRKRTKAAATTTLSPTPKDGLDVAETEASTTTAASETEPEAEPQKLMLRLAGSNIIDGKAVEGTPYPTSSSSWQFRYTVSEVTAQPEIRKTLAALRDRQAQAFTNIFETDDETEPSEFQKDLRRMSSLGRIRLQEFKDRQQTTTPVVFKESNSSRDLEEQYRRNFH